jgi:Zn-dependent M16 (insulinase) family peptidase
MYGFKKLRGKENHTFYHSKIRKETKYFFLDNRASTLLAYKKDFKLSNEMKNQTKKKLKKKKKQLNRKKKIE